VGSSVVFCGVLGVPGGVVFCGVVLFFVFLWCFLVCVVCVGFCGWGLFFFFFFLFGLGVFFGLSSLFFFFGWGVVVGCGGGWLCFCLFFFLGVAWFFVSVLQLCNFISPPFLVLLCLRNVSGKKFTFHPL